MLSLTHAKHLEKDGILFITCEIPLPRPLFLNPFLPYSPSCSSALSSIYYQEPRRFCWALHSIVYSKTNTKMTETKEKQQDT